MQSLAIVFLVSLVFSLAAVCLFQRWRIRVWKRRAAGADWWSRAIREVGQLADRVERMPPGTTVRLSRDDYPDIIE